MSLFRRWIAFNLVGLLGMGVQLATLFCLNRLMPGHYLAATAGALELTLLHNFLWHRRLTWRDRTGRESGWRQLLRFHLTNGLVSLCGNLLLMRLLVHTAHLPVLLSNACAIVCCSLLNFSLGHAWAFRSAAAAAAVNGPEQMPRPLLRPFAIVSLLLVASRATSQTMKSAGTPMSEARDSGQGARKARCVPQNGGEDCAYTNVFAGAVIAAGQAARPTAMAGVTFGQYFTRSEGKGLTASPQFEIGIVGPLPGGHPLDGLASLNYMVSGKLPRQPRFVFGTAGYTRLFATGNAVNFGLGIDLGKQGSGSLRRLELRDYFLFTGPQQHVIGIRFAFGSLIDD